MMIPTEARFLTATSLNSGKRISIVTKTNLIKYNPQK